MSEELLTALNPGKHFDRAGETIVVVDTAARGEPTRRTGSKSTRPGRPSALRQIERADRLLSRDGRQRGEAVALRHTEGDGDRPQSDLPLQPCLPLQGRPFPQAVHDQARTEQSSRHGLDQACQPKDTASMARPFPGKVSKAKSHGCVRLTNWDAERVARRVSKGTPVTFCVNSK